MRKLILFVVVCFASCGPSAEKLEEERNAEIKRNIRHNDSIVCSTFSLPDTVLYK